MAPLLDELAALRAYLRDREADGSDFLFVSQKGGRLHRSQFFRVFQAIAEAAGLSAEKRHPHALISSTMVYVRTSDVQASEAVQAALMGAF